MTASIQTAFLGRYAREVDAGLARLQEQRVLQRLWEKDASLLSADPSVQETIRDRLGWLTVPEAMASRLDDIRRFADEIRRDGITHALLLGMGGSSLFPEVCRLAFGVGSGGVDIGILDSTDPAAIRAVSARAPLTKTLAIISSKSGTTSEVLALSKYFYEAFKALDEHPGQRCIAITDLGTPLEQLAKEWGFRRIFTLGPETGRDIGGRFSALSYFGLVPAALLGMDIQRLLERGRAMLSRCGPDASLKDNPAAYLAVALGVLADQGRNKLTFLFAPPLASFGAWLEQLVAESTGKEGKGIAPVDGEPLLEPASYSDDRVFIVLQIADQVDLGLDRQARALAEAGHPVISIQWGDRYDLGGESVKWLVATTIAGWWLGVNPFDEPNVTESKNRTKALLDQYSRDKRFPDVGTPWAVESGVEIYGRGRAETYRSLAPPLAGFFKQVREQDYIALLSFLPRTPMLDEALRMIRGQIASSLGHATMLEIGPRYLHSTGQLYKGGPDTGLFLLLTADEPEDLPIPGTPFTFGILKRAQALGDFQAIQEQGRRILRVHLSGDLNRAAQRLLSAIDEALASDKSKGKSQKSKPQPKSQN